MGRPGRPRWSRPIGMLHDPCHDQVPTGRWVVSLEDLSPRLCGLVVRDAAPPLPYRLTIQGTFSAKANKRGRFQQWALRQYVTRNSLYCRDLLRILGPAWPSKVSALSAGPGTVREKVPDTVRLALDQNQPPPAEPVV